MRNFFILLVALFALAVFIPSEVSAKKALPKSTPKSTAVKKSTGGAAKGVTVNVQFRSDRKGIVANFSNLEIASKVTYSLTYSQRGVQEGAGGALGDLSGTQTRELLFATCSSGVCRYHSGIKNARFVVTTTLLNGRKVSKSFRLKV